ncbi:MAG: hypothetical protein ACP5TL_00220 [Candidatus Micrarchaeia archaeon]
MKNAQMKAQNAIEFLSTYAFMIMVIVVALLLLFMFFNIPKSAIPGSCNFYSGFNCKDEIYSNTSSGSELLIEATDMMPGTVNTSSFSAYLNYMNSTSGSCTPSFAVDGQSIYCVAHFNTKARLGQMYTGTFKIKANYCTASVSSLYNGSCPQNSNYTFAGYISLQSSPMPALSLNCKQKTIPIIITNSQKSAAPAHFQQMLRFDPSNFSSCERPDLGNIRFYYKNTELYSWCESNCTSASKGNAIFWVKLPVAVPSGKNITIDMTFLPYQVDYDGVFAGEAPQLSSKYAEYDNGANIFNFYDDFRGDALSGKWVYNANLNGTLVINNGMTYVQSSKAYAPFIYTNTNFSKGIFEAYGSISGFSGSGIDVFGLGNSTARMAIGYAGGNYGIIMENATQSYVVGGLSSGMHVWQLYVPPSLSYISASQDYGYSINTTSNMPLVQMPIMFMSQSNATFGPFYWVRARDMPPRGVMPSAVFVTK